MSRLYDRMVRTGCIDPAEHRPVIAIQNVADYFFSHDGGFGMSIAEDIPNVAPPFEEFFVEYRVPADAWISWTGQTMPPPYVGVGFSAESLLAETNLDQALKNPEKEASQLDAHIRTHLKQAGCTADEALNYTENDEDFWRLDFMTQQMIRQAVGYMVLSDALRMGDRKMVARTFEAMNKGLRWSLGATLFLEMTDTKPRPVHFFRVSVKEDGSIPIMGNGQAALLSGSLVNDPEKEAPEQIKADNDFARPFLKAALLAVSFMHCKNIEMMSHVPPFKLSKKSKRKYGAALTKYYTLDIDPMKRTLRNEGKIESIGLKRALHICRGHFKTYTDEKPLFGKRTGTYWWPQAVRGSKARGEIVKDYAVKAPQ